MFLLKEKFKVTIHPVLKLVLIFCLLFLFSRFLIGGNATSIYGTEEVRKKFHELYDEKMKEWPVPYEDIFLDTHYGIIHVMVSGPGEGEPVLLLHASGVAGWSWKYNAAALADKYRIYAIDLIGDVGKSEYTSLNNIMETGKDQAELYNTIMNDLGLDRVYIIGASEGGFIGTNIALHYPERVNKLILLGPMGYSGTLGSIIRITFAQFFPIEPVQRSTFSWAFSDSKKLMEDFGEWFILLMKNCIPKKVSPFQFTASERQRLAMPVMFIFGKKDNLVGEPETAKELVQDIPDVAVNIVNAGHLMGAEVPGEINSYILDFLRKE
jgi:pimeloyl-ACP methyl ester carboxylesterase